MKTVADVETALIYVNSRTSGVALVWVEDVKNEFYSYWRPKAPDTRAWLAYSLANAFDDGWYCAVRAIFGPISRRFANEDRRREDLESTANKTFRPDYTLIRNVLTGDFEFEYVMSCRIALQVTTPFRMIRRRPDPHEDTF